MDAGESYFQVVRLANFGVPRQASADLHGHTQENNGNSSDNAFDFCHINSVEKIAATGDYLISMRGPSTIYLIDGQSGEITWRLSGKYSNFTMGENATLCVLLLDGSGSRSSADEAVQLVPTRRAPHGGSGHHLGCLQHLAMCVHDCDISERIR